METDFSIAVSNSHYRIFGVLFIILLRLPELYSSRTSYSIIYRPNRLRKYLKFYKSIFTIIQWIRLHFRIFFSTLERISVKITSPDDYKIELYRIQPQIVDIERLIASGTSRDLRSTFL